MQMEVYVWLEEMVLKDELKYVIMEYGEQYVMMDGTMMMLEWFVDILDCPHIVSSTSTINICMQKYLVFLIS